MFGCVGEVVAVLTPPIANQKRPPILPGGRFFASGDYRWVCPKLRPLPCHDDRLKAKLRSIFRRLAFHPGRRENFRAA